MAAELRGGLRMHALSEGQIGWLQAETASMAWPGLAKGLRIFYKGAAAARRYVLGNTAPSPVVTQKQCIACRELIPIDATICSHCSTSQVPVPPERLKSVSTWLGTAGAAIGLAASLWGGVHWIEERQAERARVKAAMAIAHSQTELGDYEGAFHTLQGAVANGSASRTLANGEVDAAMLWVEHFPSYSYLNSQNPENGTAKLQEALKVLQSALADSAGARKADVLAHIGWAEWEMAEFSESAPDPSAFRAAIAVDPCNCAA
jgi:hypothetical protein